MFLPCKALSKPQHNISELESRCSKPKRITKRLNIVVGRSDFKRKSRIKDDAETDPVSYVGFPRLQYNVASTWMQ